MQYYRNEFGSPFESDGDVTFTPIRTDDPEDPTWLAYQAFLDAGETPGITDKLTTEDSGILTKFALDAYNKRIKSIPNLQSSIIDNVVSKVPIPTEISDLKDTYYSDYTTEVNSIKARVVPWPR